MIPIDSTVFLWLNATASSPHWLLKLALFASQQLPALLVAGTIGASLVGGREVRRDVVRILLAMVLAWLVARLGQHLLPMPRPFAIGLGTQWLEHGNSAGFPSTHASVAFAFGAAVAASARRWTVGLAALALATLIAWSRICLGLHFPSDVLAGAGVGVLCAGAANLIPRRTPQVRPVY
jgi:undecaprenyl-diphosphatase